MGNDVLRDRYLELLSIATFESLSAEEQKELETLGTQFPNIDPTGHEVAAAATLLAMTPLELAPMPPDLRQRIVADAPKHLPNKSATVIQPVDGNRPRHAPELPVSKGLFQRREVLAWCVAAASLLVAAFGWMDRSSSPQELEVSQLRDALMASAEDLIQVPWQAGPHPVEGEVQGDLVWSNKSQQGYMRFTGLPINDPAKQQYQLWIIDPGRDDEPIDGGVFDISADGETIVPISAKLPVVSPQAFAITIERPGGVVVSTQENLPLLAPVVTED